MYYFYMVQIESNSENKSFRILLSPNRSLSWKSTCIFLLFISITCLTIGTGFSLVGAQLILPFAGLEVILVSVCVYLVFRKTSSREVIYLSPNRLKIEKGINKPKHVWEFFRLWSSIIVEKPLHPWYPAYIVVSSKGERIPIGNFLSEEEKLQLVRHLEKIIYSYR